MIFWFVFFLTVLLDRVTKWLVAANMRSGQTIPVIADFFHITFVENPGAAFGILAEKKALFIIVTLVILGVVFYLAHTQKNSGYLLSIAYALVAGGAVGNMVDRLQTGLVVDFLDFRGIWPYIFNVADSAVVVGVLFLAVLILRSDQI